MRKRILPLIALCLMTTPVYAAGTIDAVIPVSCTAKNSNEEFKDFNKRRRWKPGFS